MRLLVDRERGRFITSAGFATAPPDLDFKRGDGGDVELRFYEGSTAVNLPSSSIIRLEVKERGKYESDPLVRAEFVAPTVSGEPYLGSPTFDTGRLETLFGDDGVPANDIASIDTMVEVSWKEPGKGWKSTDTRNSKIHNDVVKPDGALLPQLASDVPGVAASYELVVDLVTAGTDQTGSLTIAAWELGLHYEGGAAHSHTGAVLSWATERDWDAVLGQVVRVINGEAPDDGDFTLTDDPGAHPTVTATKTNTLSPETVIVTLTAQETGTQGNTISVDFVDSSGSQSDTGNTLSGGENPRDVELADVLSNAVSQTFTRAQELQFEKNLPRAFDRIAMANMPNAVSRLYDMNDPSYVGTSFNHFTLMSFADSMGIQGLFPQLSAIMQERLGIVGLGFQELYYETTSGTINGTNSSTRRRHDLWGAGTTRQMESGSVMTIADQVAGPALKSVVATDVSIYLGTESGGGTVDIERSDDNGSTWSTLEAAVSTDTPSLGVLVKSFNFTAAPTRIRLTNTGGNVEVIGALFRDKRRKGLVLCRASEGGNGLDEFVTTDQTILTTVLADVDPTAVISQYYESTTVFASSFSDYAEMIELATPTADHVYIGGHDVDSTADQRDVNNPLAREVAETTDRLEIFDTGKVMPYETIVDLGWDDPDAIHLDPEAWNYVAGVLAQSFALDGHVGNPRIVNYFQDGQNRYFRFGGSESTKNEFYVIETAADAVGAVRFGWDDDDLVERYWDFRRLADDHADAPEGFQLLNNTTNGVDEVVTFDAAGNAYFGEVGGFNAFIDFRARVEGFSIDNAKAGVSGGHRTATELVWDGYLLENTGSWVKTRTSSITAGGDAEFISARTAPVAVADLPAAASGNAGMRMFVNDASVAASGNFGSVVAGSGSNTVPVYSDGSDWRIG